MALSGNLLPTSGRSRVFFYYLECVHSKTSVGLLLSIYRLHAITNFLMSSFLQWYAVIIVLLTSALDAKDVSVIEDCWQTLL